MYSFINDYSEGAHESILNALVESNLKQSTGYGLDEYCESAKDILKNVLKNNEIDILIGTHSIIEDNVEFNNLGLVVTDEQHRFGVKQRMKLSAKGNIVDTTYYHIHT